MNASLLVVSLSSNAENFFSNYKRSLMVMKKILVSDARICLAHHSLSSSDSLVVLIEISKDTVHIFE